MKLPGLARARRAVEAGARRAWDQDRAGLGWLPALGNRALRQSVMVARGFVMHRLEMLAAALTYYTVFAIVPTLAVVLWLLRALDYLPAITGELPVPEQVLTGNDLLAVALRKVLEAVDRTSEISTGLVGLGVLLFAVSKMFRQTERALHVISASGWRTPRLSRLLGYVALLLIPPVALVLSGVVFAVLSGHLGGALARVLRAIPGFELGAGVALALGALWLAVTLLYWSAVRARIPFASAAFGAVFAAVALPILFWVFAAFQVGVSQVNAIGSGILALPVFLLWVCGSWITVLVGAEIAVAHRLDRVLVHGAATFRLDCAGEIPAGIEILVLATRAARSARAEGAVTALSEDDLARVLRLPPSVVRDLCLRLCERGFLSEWPSGFTLRCDPERTTLAAAIDALERDPALAGARAELEGRLPAAARAALPPGRAAAGDEGPTLAQLAG